MWPAQRAGLSMHGCTVDAAAAAALQSSPMRQGHAGPGSCAHLQLGQGLLGPKSPVGRGVDLVRGRGVHRGAVVATWTGSSSPPSSQSGGNETQAQGAHAASAAAGHGRMQWQRGGSREGAGLLHGLDHSQEDCRPTFSLRPACGAGRASAAVRCALAWAGDQAGTADPSVSNAGALRIRLGACHSCSGAGWTQGCRCSAEQTGRRTNDEDVAVRQRAQRGLPAPAGHGGHHVVAARRLGVKAAHQVQAAAHTGARLCRHAAARKTTSVRRPWGQGRASKASAMPGCTTVAWQRSGGPVGSARSQCMHTMCHAAKHVKGRAACRQSAGARCQVPGSATMLLLLQPQLQKGAPLQGRRAVQRAGIEVGAAHDEHGVIHQLRGCGAVHVVAHVVACKGVGAQVVPGPQVGLRRQARVSPGAGEPEACSLHYICASCRRLSMQQGTGLCFQTCGVPRTAQQDAPAARGCQGARRRGPYCRW